MPIKTSFSQNSTYVSCPKHWHFLYQEKYKSSIEGASLHFGSAVDTAVMSMLKGNTDYMDLFAKNFHGVVTKKGEYMTIFDNDNITYSNADFDEYLLNKEDDLQIQNWAIELGVEVKSTGAETVKDIIKTKRNPHLLLNKAQFKLFNRASWLSLFNKGNLLLKAFHEQFYPKIKKVHATQLYAKVQDPNTGDIINGFIDMIIEIEGYDKPIIFDLKTAAQPYTQERIELTEQLTLYAGFKGQEYQTDLVGYVVLCKQIPKESIGICEKCGYTKDGRHKTCNNLINEERCGGAWLEKKIPKPVVQVLVQQKSNEQIADLYNDYTNVITAMKNGVIYKNTSKCSDWYGSDCPYKKLCWNNDATGLTKGKDR